MMAHNTFIQTEEFFALYLLFFLILNFDAQLTFWPLGGAPDRK
jgi:hypothetical protein